MTPIRGATPTACWIALQTSLFGYWGRLADRGQNRIVAPTPALAFEGQTGSITLGGDSAWQHVPMGTSAEVRRLVDAAGNSAVRIGAPVRALILGYQGLSVENDEEGFALHTTEYKYTLALSYDDKDAAGGKGWLAIRCESDGRTARQSWFLNHPTHHHQLGGCADLRILSTRGRSLVSFIDSALRAFAPEVWGRMYTKLYRHLSGGDGAFRRLEKNERLDHDTDATLGKLLQEGRANNLDWHLELERWRADVDDQSIVAPELFETFFRRTP